MGMVRGRGPAPRRPLSTVEADELLRTDPREWVRAAEEEFDKAEAMYARGHPRPPAPDRGERAWV
jgi:hypothetical protein